MTQSPVKQLHHDAVPQDLRSAFQRFVAEVLRLHSELESAAADVSRGYGISLARWSILGTLNLYGPQTVADISRALGLRRQSVQQTVNHMRDDALIEAVPNPRHKRAPLIRMTSAGEKVMAELLVSQRTITEMFTAACPLDANDFDALADNLRQVHLPADREHPDD